jgi:5'-nucleotidase / UDP-sugar diphosphatase
MNFTISRIASLGKSLAMGVGLWLSTQTGYGQTTISIQAARVTPMGQTVSIEGIVTRAWGRVAYIQDGSAAIVVRQETGTLVNAIAGGTLQAGDRVRVTANRSDMQDNQQLMLANGAYTTGSSEVAVVARNQALPQPQVLTLAQLMTNGEQYESELVVVRNLSTNATGPFLPASTVTVSEPGGNSLALHVPASTDTEADDAPALNAPSSPFVFEGIVSQASRQYRLSIVRKMDVYQPYVLTLLHNNDGESKLLAAGTSGDLTKFGGIARFKTKIDQVRAEERRLGNAVVNVSSGDNFLAGPQWTASLNLPESEPMFDAIGMDALGYDAICLGNHDFDYGPVTLARFINSFRSNNDVFLSANLDFSPEPALQALVEAGRIAPSTIVEANGQRIGIIGLTTPWIRNISTPGRIGIQDDLAGAVAIQRERLEAQNVNKIILISHLQEIREDSALTAELSNIDIVVAGGSDAMMARTGTPIVTGDRIQYPYPLPIPDSKGIRVPVVSTAGEYKYIGKLTAWFNPMGHIIYVDTMSSGPIRVADTSFADGVLPDPTFVERINRPIEAYINGLRNTFIGTTQDTLDGVRNNIRSIETNLGNLMADAILWQVNQRRALLGQSMAHIALQNGGGIRNNNRYAAGSRISAFNTYEVAAFDNFVGIVENVSPTLVKELVEHAIARMPSPTGGFAQIAGFRFIYDARDTAQVIDPITGVLTKAGRRVKSLVLDNGIEIVRNGEVVADAPAINIATINFLANTQANGLGGDAYPFRDRMFTGVGVNYQQALYNYIVEALDGQITAADYPDQDKEKRRINPTVTRVQVIHNAPDPALASVDVYANGSKLLDNFAFRTATPYVYLPAGRVLDLAFTPGTAETIQDAIAQIPLAPLRADRDYIVMAAGVTKPADFKTNPEGHPTAFQLITTDKARYRVQNMQELEMLPIHGAPDAPAVRIIDQSNPAMPWADNLFYSSVGDYVSTAAREHLIDLKTMDDTLIATYLGALQILSPRTLVLFASGFADPAGNGAGAPGLGLYLADGDGVVYPLTPRPSGRLTNGTNAANMTVYPQPANGAVQLMLGNSAAQGNIQLEVLNMQGQVVYRQSLNPVATGTQVFTLDLPVANGSYVLRTIDAQGHSQATRLLIQRD